MGIERQATYDDNGIPAPPLWLSEMVEAKMLTLLCFDTSHTIAIDAKPEGADVVLRSEEHNVSFQIPHMAIEQIAAMSKTLVPRSALADAKPLVALLPAIPSRPEQQIGSFQVFTFIRTESGAVFYARAVDARFAVRVVFATEEATARFAVSLLAAREVVRQPKMERLDVQYTTISSKSPIESPEDLQGAVRLSKSAKGGTSGLARVGDAFAGMVPDEILSKYEQDGTPVKMDPSPSAPVVVEAPARGYEPSIVTWVLLAATVAAIVSAVLSRYTF